MGILQGLLAAGVGALQGAEQRDEREKRDAERSRAQQAQELTLLSQVLSNPALRLGTRAPTEAPTEVAPGVASPAPKIVVPGHPLLAAGIEAATAPRTVEAPPKPKEGVQDLGTVGLLGEQQHLYFDPSQTKEARAKADENEHIGKLRDTFAALGYSPEEARARAYAAATGSDVGYHPITREEGLQDLRDQGEIRDTFAKRAEERQHSARLGEIEAERENANWQVVQTDQGLVQVNPRTGEVRPLGVQPPAKKTAGAGGGKTTVAQAKALFLYRRAEPAAAIINQFDDVHTMDQLADRGGLFGNWAKTPEGQRLLQAGKTWVMTVLRQDSGAAITDREMEMYFDTYLPRPGDSAPVLAQKRQARAVVTDALQEAAGRGGTERAASPGPTRENAAGTLSRRVAELKAQGRTKDEARAILQREGLLP